MIYIIDIMKIICALCIVMLVIWWAFHSEGRKDEERKIIRSVPQTDIHGNKVTVNKDGDSRNIERESFLRYEGDRFLPILTGRYVDLQNPFDKQQAIEEVAFKEGWTPQSRYIGERYW